MSDDNGNVSHLRMPPEAWMNAVLRAAETFRPPPAPDLELALWDDIVRMRLSYPGPDLGVPLHTEHGGRVKPNTPMVDSVQAAIDAANRVVRARRAFKEGK